MSDPFNIEELKSGMQSDRDRINECIEWCTSALQGFVNAAGQVGTPLVELDMSSMAAQASGIALAPWPTVNVNGTRIARYYRVLRYSEFEIWPAQDGRGVTLSPDGQVFVQGRASNVADASAYIAQLVGFDLDQAKELFTSALRGEAFGIS